MNKSFALALLCCLAMTFYFPARAQNLVRNPGFEDFTRCPTAISQFDGGVVPGWNSPSTVASPDYFNRCSNSQECGIPNNYFGYQWPHAGKGMAGIIAWEGINTGSGFINIFSEYVQTRLTQSLQAGRDYCVSFFVNNAIDPSDNLKNFIALDEVGISFASSEVRSANSRTFNMPYHVRNSAGNFIADSAGWTKISTMYRASGNEQWLVIGVFTDGTNPPSFTKIDPGSNKARYHAYLYIDDVSVEAVGLNDTVKTLFDTAYCNANTLPFGLESKHTDGVGVWNDGSTGNKLTINQPGKYWCRTYTNCRWYIDTFDVKYDPQKELNLGKKLANCNYGSVTIKPKYRYKNYLWSNGSKDDSIVVNTPGKYYLTVSGDCGSQTDTVEVFIQGPTPAPLVSDTIICENITDAVLRVQGSSLMWYTSPEGLVGYSVQPAIDTRQLGTRVYYVSQSQGPCESERVPMKVYVKYTPKDELLSSATMCERFPDTIGKQLPDVQFKWSNGYNFCCLTPTYEGLFRVAVSNECGTYIDSVNVQFSACDTCIRMPNVFSPNSDGLNDLFKPIILCPVYNYHLAIYNRWGNKIFESSDPAAGWDGRSKGALADNGAYVYSITYKAGATGRPKTEQGQVILLR